MLALPQEKLSPRRRPVPAEPKSDRAPVRRAAEAGSAWRQLATAVPVSRPGDPAELEADRAADALMRGERVGLSPQSSGGEVRRLCAACEDELAGVKRQAEPGEESAGASGAARPLASGGKPLSPEQRAFFEPRLSADLSPVRIHTGTEASASARAFGARAYTFGRHIVFGPGAYDPATAPGRRLLGHELAHTVQQGAAALPLVQREGEDEPPKKYSFWEEFLKGFDFSPKIPSPKDKPADMPEACKLDPHAPGCPSGTVDAPGLKTLLDPCGSAPDLPFCKPKGPSPYACPPGFAVSTASATKGQCCLEGTIADPRSCCPASRASTIERRCCGPDEVKGSDGRCSKPASATPLCPPQWMTARGECCRPPLVSDGLHCVEPSSNT